MKNKSFIFVLVIFLHLISVNQLFAQTNKSTIYKAYISGDMTKWASVIQHMEKQHAVSVDANLELISYYYGYIGYLLGTKKIEQAQLYMARGEKLIAAILKASPQQATAYAFKGSFIGFRIAVSKFKAISLGPESMKYVEKACELDANNVQGLVDKANALYHTPKLFGGDKEQALKLFYRAIKLLENSRNTSDNWFYLNVLTLTAKTHESLNQLSQAKAMYEKAIRFEPEYKWVKNELYPKLLKKME